MLTTCIVLAAASLTSLGDPCNPAIPYTMPDLDQSRTAAPGIQGLPSGGSNYCVPTATMNVMKYFANHGYPGLVPGPGPWLGTPATYQSMTTALGFMGIYMNTHPDDGTSGTNAFNGVNQWFSDSGIAGDIVVTAKYVSNNDAPELGDIAFCLLAGYPVTISVGWYLQDPQIIGQLDRSGGHSVTVKSLPDFCTNFRKIAIRDPGNGGDSTTQQPGTTETYAVQSPLRVLVDNDGNEYYSGPLERMIGFGSGSKNGYIDGYRAYLPTFGIAACNNPVNGSCVTQYIPNPSVTTLPQQTHFDLPQNPAVLDLDIRADNMGAWMLVQTPREDPALHSYTFGPSSAGPVPTSFPALTPFNPRRICTGRNHHSLYLLDTNPNLIVELNTRTGTATPRTIADAGAAICFDHIRNELVVLSTTARRISRLNPDTFAPISVRTLPTSIAIGSTPRISICPKGAYVWLTSGTTTGYGLTTLATSSVMTIAATISAPNPLLGVDADNNGHIFTSSGGQIIEFAEPAAPTPGGPWSLIPSSRFAPLADGPVFRIARNRSNIRADIHDTRPWTMNELPTSFTTAVPDCRADFNNSGAVSVQDVFDFLTAYFSQNLAADFNDSATVSVQDIFDFLTAYFAGC